MRAARCFGATIFVLGCSPTGTSPNRPSADVATGGGGSGSVGTGGAAGSNIIVAPRPDAGDGAAPFGQPAVSTGPPPDWNCGPTCFRDTLVPADAVNGFGGPPTEVGKPVVVYPLDGSMHPINIGDITFQFRRTDVSQTVFRIDVQGDTTYSFYVPCQTLNGGAANECVFHAHDGDWRDITFHLRGKTATIVVKALTGASVATSLPINVRYSSVDVAGGLYYWSTSLPGTYRLLFGAKRALPFITPATPTINPFRCSGCHAVSRKGNVIAFTEGDLASGYLALADTADPSQQTLRPPSTGPMIHDSAMMALNPDGTRVLTSFDSKLVLRDTQNGQVLGTVDPSFLAGERGGYFPEFSPDGKEIVLTLSSQPDVEWSVRSGHIAILPYNDGQFGAARIVVPGGADFHFYPTFSPDGNGSHSPRRRWIRAPLATATTRVKRAFASFRARGARCTSSATQRRAWGTPRPGRSSRRSYKTRTRPSFSLTIARSITASFSRTALSLQLKPTHSSGSPPSTSPSSQRATHLTRPSGFPSKRSSRTTI